MNISTLAAQCVAQRTLEPMLKVHREDLKHWMISVDGDAVSAESHATGIIYTACRQLNQQALEFRLEVLRMYLDREQSKRLETNDVVAPCGNIVKVDPREQQRLDSQWILGMCCGFIAVAGAVCVAAKIIGALLK